MAPTIYALLVGIDDYPSESDRLKGCVNDAAAWYSFLKKHAQKLGYEFQPLILNNKEATRQAIIDGFTHHLANAKQADLAVFFFAGHGSQEPGRIEFGQNPNKDKNQTLVCCDSRTDRGWDLVDKEISNLVALVASSNPQITLIMDCCHSGSSSRENFVERRVESDKRKHRPIESYFVPSAVKGIQNRVRGSVAQGKQGPFQLLKGRHILLAACHETETAKEIKGRGVFSSYLQNALSESTREWTYAELLTKVRHAMKKNNIPAQIPQLEIIEGDEKDRHCFFLRKEQQADNQGLLTVSYDDERDDWIVNSGGICGWPENIDNPGIELSIFPFSSTPEEVRRSVGQLAVARVKQVFSVQSSVAVEGRALDTAVQYKALVIKAIAPTVPIYLQGTSTGVDTLRRSIDGMNTDRVNAKIVSSKAQATVVLDAGNRDYGVIRGPKLGEPLDVAMASLMYDPPIKTDVVEPLVNIAKWQQLCELTNPQFGRIPRKSVELQLWHNGQTFSGLDEREVCLKYDFKNGDWTTPIGKLRLVNNSDLRLYCGVFELSPDFSIDAQLFEEAGVWLMPNTAVDVETLDFVIPSEFLRKGVFEAKTLLKLIASTKQFNPYVWHQGDLEESLRRGWSVKGRDRSDEQDWMTQDLWIRNIHPRKNST